ncbi:hypothetical protein C8Q76DRAFT_789029 [Earliella scabrosa]|nr:hypothetical protein C8Q76DRAFT_789029 [Earliella scabrosa]
MNPNLSNQAIPFTRTTSTQTHTFAAQHQFPNRSPTHLYPRPQTYYDNPPSGEHTSYHVRHLFDPAWVGQGTGVLANSDAETPREVGAQTVEEIPQMPYAKGRTIRPSLSSRGAPSHPAVAYNQHCSLTKALEGDFSEIPDHGSVAFDDVTMAQKMSYRFQFVGYKPYSRQVTVLCVGKGAQLQPTKGSLATLAAREIKRFIEECENRKDAKAFPYEFDQLVLLEIRLVSRGSLQPCIGVIRNMGSA